MEATDNARPMPGRRYARAVLLWVGAVAGVLGCGNGEPVDAGPLPSLVLGTLDPSSSLISSSALQLHVEGGVFTDASVVQWMGSPLATTLVSAQQLDATIPASDLNVPVQALVNVYEPARGYSNALSFGVFDPRLFPTLTSLNPMAIPLGSPVPTLLLTGTNFVPASVAQWNGTPLTTSYVSSTQLQAQVGDALVSIPGAVVVTVTNPPPGGGTSQGLPFDVDSPAPVLTSLSPSSTRAGNSDVFVVLSGYGFTSSSTLLWNGVTPLTPSDFLPTELDVSLPAALLGDAGTFSLAVVNGPPGGGTSSLPFTVTPLPADYPHLAVPLASNDMVWNASAGVLYLSVPGSATAYGNSVAVLDPDAGAIVASLSVGSEPGPLALSQDGQFLYVALNGAASVQRLMVPSLAPSLMYSLGPNPFGGTSYTVDLQVAPGLPHTTAVALGVVSYGRTPAILIFDDGTLRGAPPSSVSFQSYDTLQWGADAAHLYAANTESTAFDFYALSVDAGGASLVADYGDVFPGFSNRIHFDSATGFLYGDDGQVVNPATGLHVGVFELPKNLFETSSALMVPDSQNGRAFFLTFSEGEPGAMVQVFDITHFTPITSVGLTSVQGTPKRFVRWGTRGLAFTTDSDFVYLLSGGFVDGSN